MRVLKGGTGIVGPDIATQPAAAGVLIVVNESGMSLLPTCLKAASGGFDIIAITASHDTPVSKLAKVNVVIKNNKSTPEAYEPTTSPPASWRSWSECSAGFRNGLYALKIAVSSWAICKIRK